MLDLPVRFVDPFRAQNSKFLLKFRACNQLPFEPAQCSRAADLRHDLRWRIRHQNRITQWDRHGFRFKSVRFGPAHSSSLPVGPITLSASRASPNCFRLLLFGYYCRGLSRADLSRAQYLDEHMQLAPVNAREAFGRHRIKG